MSDVHGEAGRTMSAGEATLRQKMKALANQLLHDDDPNVNNAGQMVWDVLTGELDPRAGGPR
jgi:hypothetical protein